MRKMTLTIKSSSPTYNSIHNSITVFVILNGSEMFWAVNLPASIETLDLLVKLNDKNYMSYWTRVEFLRIWLQCSVYGIESAGLSLCESNGWTVTWQSWRGTVNSPTHDFKTAQTRKFIRLAFRWTGFLRQIIVWILAFQAGELESNGLLSCVDRIK